MGGRCCAGLSVWELSITVAQLTVRFAVVDIGVFESVAGEQLMIAGEQLMR